VDSGSPSLVHHRISPKPPPLTERLRELVGAKDLGLILVRRELQLRYKQTALGIAWIVLQPLGPALIFAVVFGSFARLPSAGAPYLLFALAGLVLYGFFSGIVSRAGSSLIRDGSLISKIYFPRSILPLAAGIAAIVDLTVGLGVIVVFVIALGQPMTLAVLVLPVVVALTLTLALGLGLAVAALSARLRDVAYVVPFLLQLLLYGSPVVYSMEILPQSLANALAINPLVPLIEAFRWSILGTPAPNVTQIAIGTVSGLVMTVAGIGIFSRASRDIADVV
jgi:lipopolysaccharide transport system permease protein